MNKAQLLERWYELSGEELEAKDITADQLKENIAAAEAAGITGPQDLDSSSEELPSNEEAETKQQEVGETATALEKEQAEEITLISDEALDKAVKSMGDFTVNLARGAFNDKFAVVYMLASMEHLKEELARGAQVSDEQLEASLERVKHHFVHLGPDNGEVLALIVAGVGNFIEAARLLIEGFHKSKA